MSLYEYDGDCPYFDIKSMTVWGIDKLYSKEFKEKCLDRIIVEGNTECSCYYRSCYINPCQGDCGCNYCLERVVCRCECKCKKCRRVV